MNSYSNYGSNYGPHRGYTGYTGYNQSIYQPIQPQTISAQNQPATNKMLVTGKDAALNMPAPNGSDLVYFDQDKDLMYNVITDWNGRKTIRVFALSESSDTAQAAVKPEDFAALLKRVEALEAQGAKQNAE